MRRRKRYGLAYLLVLLAAVAGFFLIRERARAIETPQMALPGSAQQVITELDLFGLFTRLIPAVTPAASPTPSIPVRTPEPVVVQGIEPAATPAVRSSQHTLPAEPNSSAGCCLSCRRRAALCAGWGSAQQQRRLPGSVDPRQRARCRRQPAGGVRLWRYDQLGNEAVVESQSGDAERGQYDFPFDDTLNVHYVQVIDAGGVIISPVIEIQHRQGEAADALCHWVDWQQR